MYSTSLEPVNALNILGLVVKRCLQVAANVIVKFSGHKCFMQCFKIDKLTDPLQLFCSKRMFGTS